MPSLSGNQATSSMQLLMRILEGDVAGEREDRRAAEGFVSPADARSFLGLARSGEAGDERDAITRAYFRNLGGAGVGKREPARGARLVAAAGDLGKLTRVLEEAEVVGSTASQPIAALGSGRRGASVTRLLGERGEISRAIEALTGTPADVLFRRGFGAAANGGHRARA
ncbi:MAG TPA: hypothetical protein VJV78_07670 [Polyangiales bacterium]|nr:hypothetical protein [Polyangiales bacterium]